MKGFVLLIFLAFAGHSYGETYLSEFSDYQDHFSLEQIEMLVGTPPHNCYCIEDNGPELPPTVTSSYETIERKCCVKHNPPKKRCTYNGLNCPRYP